MKIIPWAQGTRYGQVSVRPVPTAVPSMVLFAESASTIKVISLMCIVLGIIGLKSSS